MKSNKDYFVQSYFRINRQMWKLYDNNLVGKKEIRELRFKKVLQAINVKDRELSLQLEDHFLSICPSKGHLIIGTIELLESLFPKYKLHILTNGFLETQNIKIQTSKIDHYFDSVTTSECSGYKKPDPKVFNFKLDKIGANKNDSLMIGDNLLTDIGGARRSGIDQVFFNPTRKKHNEKITYEVSELAQISDYI